MTNQIRLTLIAFMSYMVMSGLLTQAGVILNAIAGQLGLPAAEAVKVFSWLTGGALVGTCISMYLYTRFSLGLLLSATYVTFLLLMGGLYALPGYGFGILGAVLFGLGVCCGCGLSGGAVIISRIYRAQRRASAFIATDCSFSAAGYIFPTLAGWLLVQKLDWRLSYIAVALLAVLILVLVFTSTLPDTQGANPHQGAQDSDNAAAQFKRIITPRVMCFAVGVCLYLIAQTTFLTWAPNYLMVEFSANQKTAGQIVGNYWGFSIFGLLLSVVLVNMVPTRVMLLTVSSLAVCFTCAFLILGDLSLFLSLGIAFGLLTTCIYKIAISVGTQQITDSPPMLVTLMLFSGSVGSTLAPALSGMVVAVSDESGALMLSFVAFAVMLIMFTIAVVLEKRKEKLIMPGTPGIIKS
ncbi:MFS transporter TsgA [Alteromonas gilva]|uniref:MFS transporter TsgA n=1 Tax=Alteromonas gilva TaxID=2987522 RepID=A0ABT5KYX2_9ALTE|nr:MFS transporter TsgA [Alteromonas gilva]MDC8829970.1 MFS transporter TsgA [Alteromonas gilva]